MIISTLGFTSYALLVLANVFATSIPLANPSFETLLAGGLPNSSAVGCCSLAPIARWTNSGTSGQVQRAANSALYNSEVPDSGKPLTIRLTSAGTQSNFDKMRLDASPTNLQTLILPQLAFGGGWYTALYFTNTNTAAVSFTVSLLGDDGNPVTMPPLTMPALGGSPVTVNLAARGTTLIELPNAGPLIQGYVRAALPAGVTGYGVFRQTVPGVPDQEAVVPLSENTATTSTILFDDTRYTTAVAVVNLASVNNTITVTARDNNGNVLGTGGIPLAANGKTALVLRTIPGLANIAGAIGSVDFTTTIGNVAALGLRFNGTAFTSIPTSDR